MEKRKISLITIIIGVIVVLTIGIGVGYIISENVKKGNIVKEASSEDVKTQIQNDRNDEIINDVVKNEEIINNEVVSTNKDGRRVLNQNELDLFEKYLEAPGIWNFIYTTYNDLSEFNLSSFLRYYYRSVDATKEQIKDITGEDESPVPVHLFSKVSIDDIFKKYTGKDVSVINKDLLPMYSEKYNSYYNRTSDAEFKYIDVISGIEEENKYTIKYTSFDYSDNKIATYELILNKVNGEYLFVSNVKI